MNLRTSAVAVLMLAVAVLAVPGAASAQTRAGSTTDLVGDSAGSPSQDIVAASATYYRSSGQLMVSVTVNGDITSGLDSFFAFGVASSPDTPCTGSPRVAIGSFSSAFDGDGAYIVDGESSGVAPKSVAANKLSLQMADGAIEDKDYQCMTVTVRPKAAGADVVVDQLNFPLFFDGYGPDTDGDSVKDSTDDCPFVVGLAPTGCPLAAAPPPPVVAPPPPRPSTANLPLGGRQPHIGLKQVKKSIKLKQGLRDGVKYFYSCELDCSVSGKVTARLTGPVRLRALAKSLGTVATATPRVLGAKSGTFTIRFSRAARNRLAKQKGRIDFRMQLTMQVGAQAYDKTVSVSLRGPTR